MIRNFALLEYTHLLELSILQEKKIKRALMFFFKKKFELFFTSDIDEKLPN